MSLQLMSLQTIVTPPTDSDQLSTTPSPLNRYGIVEVPWVAPVPPETSQTYFGSFLVRVLQDALTQATAEFWERRAQTFEWAAPRVGEYHGRLTKDQLRERWYECMGAATACRRHAELIRQGLLTQQAEDEIHNALGEAA